MKNILDGSGKCFYGFRFQYKQGYQSGRGKDAIAFSEQMIFGYDILLMTKGMGKFFLREVGDGMLNGSYKEDIVFCVFES